MEVKHKLLNFDNMVIYQNDEWFNFSLDSVLLANFVTINLRVKKIIDFATGNAPIPMLLTYKTHAKIYGVEIQKEVYDLGVKSVKENDMNKQIILINDDIKNIKQHFESDTFDVVTCNPPYFKIKDDSYMNENNIKNNARHEALLDLNDVLESTKKILKNNGIFAMVHRPERLIEIIEVMKKNNIEPKRVQFVYPKEDSNSNIILIEGIKNGKPGLKILPPLYIHNNDGNYREEIRKMFEE